MGLLGRGCGLRDPRRCDSGASNGPRAPGDCCLSGPVETLMKARTARRIDLELGDGTKLPVRMFQASHSGMALVVIDPKLLPSRSN
jgi:hypothetical protein